MAKIELLNINGEKVKDIKLKDNVWTIEPNDAVLHNDIVAIRSNARMSNASTKTRSEVSGGGRKPWRQKGTGNARQGSIRATQWRGGGIVFGPNPNKNYKKKINKKEKRLALLSALSYKLTDKELVVVDELTENVCLACRNLPNVKLVTFEEVNAFDTVNADNMLITESALNKLEEVLTRE